MRDGIDVDLGERRTVDDRQRSGLATTVLNRFKTVVVQLRFFQTVGPLYSEIVTQSCKFLWPS